MNDWQQTYNEWLSEKLKSMPYEAELDFIHNYLPEIPLGKLYVQPSEMIDFAEKKYNYYLVGNVFNALVNLEPIKIHKDYMTALSVLELVMKLSTEWEKIVAPVRHEIHQKVMREQALQNKKILTPKNGLVIPGNFKR